MLVWSLETVTERSGRFIKHKSAVFHDFYSLCVDRWFRQHEHIEKLNMQAILNASAVHDEFVKELLVSYGKVTATSL